ncbi:MAG TPA: zf-HC2 domain-containing protein [Candidatus Sulfotelmatobacter sp.]|nr:zf-HC2 domain-containing protein [Candidatus Sulfotelmatobacter sp.]
MPCEQWAEKIDLYVDGELSADDARALSTHLRGCADCANDVLGRVQMKRTVHLAGRTYTPSADLRSKIAASISPKPAPASFAWWKWPALAAAALIVILSVVSFTSFQRRESARREQIYSELADLHVGTLASSAPVDVVSTDRHTVKPWFQGKIPFTFVLPELQGSDFTLLGGRVTYFEQAPAAHLIYKIRQHDISVFIVQEALTPRAAVPPNTSKKLAFNIESWTQEGLRYFVISDTSAADVHRLSEMLKQAK